MDRYLNFDALCRALPSQALRQIPDLPYPRVASGKVRELFDTGEALLIIATDRLSAFDVVLPDGIPGKGIILTQMSLYWFDQSASLIPNHLVPAHQEGLREVLQGYEDLIPRSMLVRKLQPLPIEAVVRKYLAGSAWKDYLKTGTVFGLPAPAGLRESEALPVPLFTPTTKAVQGEHDLPVTEEEGMQRIGEERFAEVREVSLRLFAMGSAAARRAGLILADTKFEFGTNPEGSLFLIDEALTPDSSRYWPLAGYELGHSQTAFDKQYIRDYLETLDWNKTAPGPTLPPSVIDRTRERYLEAASKILNL